jgi:hypothetical protein
VLCRQLESNQHHHHHLPEKRTYPHTHTHTHTHTQVNAARCRATKNHESFILAGPATCRKRTIESFTHPSKTYYALLRGSRNTSHSGFPLPAFHHLLYCLFVLPFSFSFYILTSPSCASLVVVVCSRLVSSSTGSRAGHVSH